MGTASKPTEPSSVIKDGPGLRISTFLENMANTQDQTALTASRTELASQVKSVTDADWRAYLTYKLSGLDAIIAAQDPSQDIETLVTQLTEALQGAMQLDFQ